MLYKSRMCVYMPGIIHLRTTLMVFHPRAANGFSDQEIGYEIYRSKDRTRDIMIDLFGRRIE